MAQRRVGVTVRAGASVEVMEAVKQVHPLNETDCLDLWTVGSLAGIRATGHYGDRMKTLAAAAACLLLAGCGSDDSAKDSTAAPETITKAEFIERGDAICKAGDERIEAATESFGEDDDFPTESELRDYVVEVVLPEISAQAKALRALPLPDQGADQVTAMLDSLDAEIAKAEKDPGHPLEEASGFDEANLMAQEYGFEVCGAEEE